MPAAPVLIVEAVAPVLQANVAEPVPPDGVAVNTAELPEHTSALFTETLMPAFAVKVPAPDPVQPFASVTVTEYVPDVLVLIVDAVAPLLHAYDFEPVPLETVAVSVPETFGQASALFTETIGFGSIVSVPEPEPVHPFVSVTVTE